MVGELRLEREPAMRLELAIDVPAMLTENERVMVHSLICDALCEYTVHVLRNNANPTHKHELGAVGLDGKGVLECRNGLKIVETLVATA